MKRLCLLLALLLVSAATAAPPAERVWLGAGGKRLPFETAAEAVDFLANARVVSWKELSTGITRPKKLVLERDGVRAHAVYHQIDRRERKVKRLRNGQLAHFLIDSHKSQVAAYELSQLLGLEGVPPTALREVDGRVGSVQLWIENAVTEQQRRERSLDPPDRVDWNQQKADQWVFDNLINNIDRNTGNTLIDEAWNLWLIDHTRSFGQDRQLPYPERISSISKELWAGLRALDEREVRGRLEPYLGKSELRALLVRREKLVEAIEARIARLGGERVVYERGKPWIAIGWTPVDESESSSGSSS